MSSSPATGSQRDARSASPPTIAHWSCSAVTTSCARASAHAIRATAASDTGFELVVVGEHASQERFEDLARACGVRDRVHFFGARTDTATFFQASDVFVLPSQADLWGVTVLEAMACGIPPVVSADVGSATAVTEGVDGFVLTEPPDGQEPRPTARSGDRRSRSAEADGSPVSSHGTEALRGGARTPRRAGSGGGSLAHLSEVVGKACTKQRAQRRVRKRFLSVPVGRPRALPSEAGTIMGSWIGSPCSCARSAAAN